MGVRNSIKGKDEGQMICRGKEMRKRKMKDDGRRGKVREGKGRRLVEGNQSTSFIQSVNIVSLLHSHTMHT